MPVEGQWERANTPLGRRDKRLLAAAGVVAAIAVAAFAVLYLTRSTSPASARGCLSVDVPSTMGGARLRVCGAAAHAFCRAQGGDARIAVACRRQGFAADLP